MVIEYLDAGIFDRSQKRFITLFQKISLIWITAMLETLGQAHSACTKTVRASKLLTKLFDNPSNGKEVNGDRAVLV